MSSRVEKVYKPALTGKKIPTLTLDHKWHQLFTQIPSSDEIEKLENELNQLLKRQGKLTNEVKEIKKLKSRLMDEIVALMDKLQDGEPNKTDSRTLDDHKKLINECNDKLDQEQDELLDLPKEIDALNYQLMLATMDSCYETLHKNSDDIDAIASWVAGIRTELKMKLIEKQEKEMINHGLYSYMHDIFGADVIEIFDMKYNPEEHPIKKNENKKSEEKE